MDYLLVSVSDPGDLVQTSSSRLESTVQGMRDKGNQKFISGPPKLPFHRSKLSPHYPVDNPTETKY